MLNNIQEGLKEFKQGKMVIVVDDEDRENEGDFIIAAEFASPEIINFMSKEGRGLICVALTEDRCSELDLQPMVSSNTSLHETAFTVSIDLIGKGTTTGISAQDRAKTIDNFVDKNPNDILVFGPNGKTVRARTANQKKMVQAADRNDVVFAIGPAGTGKTYTAVALAVRALKNKMVKKIILTRPAVEAGESLGFLPGDLKEKIDPYLRPLYDALDDMIPADKLGYYMTTRTIEIAPLAYMRGRTLDNAFIILDEAQNTNDLQLKMFLTRIGANAKAIITGDPTQVDLPRNMRSGLDKAIRILDNIDGIAHIALNEEDVVRHRLVKSIIKAYEKEHEKEEQAHGHR